uniref:Gfo/Idh/MocA-like oxidoreductase N-terminal domain-containing protein n=1 Tax=Arcella intermedia TaxID=1963864 RepID=A0A6B2L8X6_9EUKA|eukprot:TRINITY_DN27_c0_g1_i1.p1 TRINITY_DN27_c0_g1~~TRINITY_DN27_c0_g1_i1.p1  ORF type:complete len:353 (+),score=53.28 TRINITY_DN27_c0_g1_i1:38-1060(+)
MSKKVSIALCGFGRIGQVHLESLLHHPDVAVTAIVDVDFERVKAKADSLGVAAFKTMGELLGDGKVKVDGVLICTPTSTHVDYIRQALLAGKQVMCEKPISNSIQEVDELYTLAKEKGLHLLCGFHRRYDPNFAKLKDVVSSGTVGKLLKVRSISRDNPLHVSVEYLKVSGGIIADTASHDIDMVRHITGEDPVTVYATGSASNPAIAAIPDHDQLDMIFTFPSGVIAAIDISRTAAYGYDQRLEILAEKGSVVVDNQKQTTVVVGLIDGFKSEPPCFSFPERYKEAYRTEVGHFVDLVKGTAKEARLSHKDVHNITAILKACQQSLKEGVPVKLSKELI